MPLAEGVFLQSYCRADLKSSYAHNVKNISSCASAAAVAVFQVLHILDIKLWSRHLTVCFGLMMPGRSEPRWPLLSAAGTTLRWPIILCGVFLFLFKLSDKVIYTRLNMCVCVLKNCGRAEEQWEPVEGFPIG